MPSNMFASQRNLRESGGTLAKKETQLCLERADRTSFKKWYCGPQHWRLKTKKLQTPLKVILTQLCECVQCTVHLKRLTCASLCWLSASPGHTRAWWASWISKAEPSITWQAESNMPAAAWSSMLLAATPLAAWASDLRAWAVSLAATPVQRTNHWRLSKSPLCKSYSAQVLNVMSGIIMINLSGYVDKTGRAPSWALCNYKLNYIISWETY